VVEGGQVKTRREVLLGGASLCCLPGLALGAKPTRLIEVAPGIHVRRGVDEEATPANADAIANVGCIIGSRLVAVMDPGGSLEDGQRLREAIRAITKVPIGPVILSHVHPDHVFGAGAFKADTSVFVGHERLAGAMAQRAQYYRTRLDQAIGEHRAGPVVEPGHLISGPEELDLGGRKLLLTPHGIGHSNCDLSVFDTETSTLFAADILFVKRTPSLDGSLLGWLKQIAELKKVPAKRAVPGHGPVQVPWPAGAADLERYLGVLLRETRAAIAKGLEITEAVETVGRSERGKWTLFEEYHGHNVTKAFKELEWE
jgi:quinoprotein relay system zinc metallohydrolase 2